jgi:transcriptional regulator GlxA family with amidase domain
VRTPPPIDTLAVIGGMATWHAAEDAGLVAAIRSAAGRSRRVVSTCPGAFLLAAAGALDGRRATTHWDCAARLARQFVVYLRRPVPTSSCASCT